MIGARPQFIKAAALSLEIKNRANINEVIVHTGQHYDQNMSGIFFDQLRMPKPNYTLTKPAGNNSEMISSVISELNRIIFIEKPDYLLVYGDTDTTLAGALAANKNKLKLIHVEAGLRSFNIDMPEEVNRRVTDMVSCINFVTDDIAVRNLETEKTAGQVVKVGDIMLETLQLVLPELEKLQIRNYVLSTVHRPSNVDNENNLFEIVQALVQISQDQNVIIPVHPRTREKFIHILKNLDYNPDKLKIIEPVGYIEMMQLLQSCSFVITDSGGLQKEAVMLQKPCIVLRLETEWKALEQKKYLVTLDNISTRNILSKLNFEFHRFNEFAVTKYNVSKKICDYILNYHKQN